jgi:hypothetical protein
MKKHSVMLAVAALALAACNKNRDEIPEPSAEGLLVVEDGVYYLGSGAQEFDVPAGTYTLTPSHTYVLRGWVYLKEGATLNIQPGTVVKGETSELKGAALIVEKGAKIYAKGTPSSPVVFTSDRPVGQRKPGDWGGLILCGKAKNNQNDMQIEGGPSSHHGGSDDGDSSGELSYVRVEFAGYPLRQDQEINGMTFGSVGSGTVVHHVQVSYSNDDSFEWFGGAVNCKYLVAYHGWDDDFDTDNGFSGRLQFLLGVRHPKIADQSRSNGFESDNCSSASKDAQPFTTASFCNATLLGPIGQDAAFVNNASEGGGYINAGALWPNNGSRTGQFQAGMQIRRNSRLSVANSLVAGYPVGLMVEDDKVAGTQEFATSNHSLKNIFFAGYADNVAEAAYANTAGATPILGCDKDNTFKDWSGVWDYGASSFTGTPSTKSASHSLALDNDCRAAAAISTLLTNPVSFNGSAVNKTPDFRPQAGSALLGSSFTVPTGFDAAGNGYIGAFGASDNWTAGWTCFDPQNEPYN